MTTTSTVVMLTHPAATAIFWLFHNWPTFTEILQVRQVS